MGMLGVLLAATLCSVRRNGPRGPAPGSLAEPRTVERQKVLGATLGTLRGWLTAL